MFYHTAKKKNLNINAMFYREYWFFVFLFVPCSGGDYGRLMVFYSTSVLSLVDLVQQNNGNILDLFESPYEGVPEQLEGTAVDLTNLNNARQVGFYVILQHCEYQSKAF